MNSFGKLLVVAFVAVCAVLFVHGDVSHLNTADDEAKPVTDVCLGCICEAISGCNNTLQCNGDVCGLFRITWAYWSDAGKPTVGNEPASSDTAYSNCVIEPYCAANAVQGYMKKFGQDCNSDGKINCHDHASIHILGGYGCKGDLPHRYGKTFEQCLAQFQG